MNGVNRCTLLGNLTADPELRFTQTGTAVLNIRLATNEKWKNKDGEWVESVQYHNAVLWGKRGEALAKFLRKGNPVYIEGGLRTSSYEKEGIKHYKTEVNVTEVVLLGGKRDGGGYDDSPDEADAGDNTTF